MPSQDEIIRSALELPEEQRAEVLRRILASFDGRPDADAERAWAEEVARRIHDLSISRAGTVSAREALDRARARLAQ